MLPRAHARVTSSKRQESFGSRLPANDCTLWGWRTPRSRSSALALDHADQNAHACAALSVSHKGFMKETEGRIRCSLASSEVRARSCHFDPCLPSSTSSPKNGLRVLQRTATTGTWGRLESPNHLGSRRCKQSKSSCSSVVKGGGSKKGRLADTAHMDGSTVPAGGTRWE